MRSLLVILAAAILLLIVASIALAQSQKQKTAMTDDVHQLLVSPSDGRDDFNKYLWEEEPFAVTAQHIELIRRLRLHWDSAETGAPASDPKRPYGDADTLKVIASVSDAKTIEDQARWHTDSLLALKHLSRHGRLEPGDYALRNITAAEIVAQMDGLEQDGETISEVMLGFTSDGKFWVTADHIAVIRVLQFQWTFEDEAEGRLGRGAWPGPGLDAKRPYGDLSYYQADLAHILERPTEMTNGEKSLAPNVEAEMTRLHWQMFPALQAFIEHAELPPGDYK